MEIKIGKTAGFCFGVKNAVKKTEEMLQKENHVYCLGELVHNSQVMEKLESKGLRVIHNLEEVVGNNEGKVIIRAHGVSPKIYEEASLKKIELVDFTCPKVAHIHEKVKQYIREQSYIFIIGTREHPEIIGIYGFCYGSGSIIEKKEDIHQAMLEFNTSKLKKIAVIVQTTFSISQFDEIVKVIKDRIEKENNNIELKIDNTICNATEERQKEAEQLSKESDIMIIIGGKNSSNTKKLYEISLQYCRKVIFIETANELKKEMIENNKKIGIMAGASTPEESIVELMEVLNGYC